MKSSILGIFLWLFSQLTYGHAIGSSFLHLTELSPGTYTLRWAPAKELQYVSQAIKPIFPQHCKQQEQIIICGEEGLSGLIKLDNLPLHADTIVRIEWLNGNQHTEILNKDSDTLILSTNISSASSWAQVFNTYTFIGIEHILIGIDHILFIVGLILLVGFNKRLIWTITAFTLAHSLTLALSVLGIATIPQTPVETIIALSIVLVAVEALDKRITLARRRPWLVAFIFGLVHGLGFAGALREVGLPEHELPLSLLSFNLGVEIGQLGVIAGLYVLTALASKSLLPRYQAQSVVILVTYAIGSLGAYWAISRSADLFGLS